MYDEDMLIAFNSEPKLFNCHEGNANMSIDKSRGGKQAFKLNESTTQCDYFVCNTCN